MDKQMPDVKEDIAQLCGQIFMNLGVDEQMEDMNQLFEEQIYYEIYKIMFPFLDEDIKRIAQMPVRTGVKIQELIDLLSAQVLTMDLSHIKGEAIERGDQKHLYYFLQLLFELSRLYLTQNNEQMSYDDNMETNIRSNPLSRNMSDREGDYQRNHSVMGINQEFEDGSDYLGYYPPNYDEYQQNVYLQNDQAPRKNARGEKISEVSKSKESSQYDPKKMFQKKEQESAEQAQDYMKHISEDREDVIEPKQIHRSKSTRDLGDQPPVNNKQNQLRALEDNILQVTQKQQRVITNNPNLGSKKTQQIPQEIVPMDDEISEIDINFLETVDHEQMQRLPETDPQFIKYQREIEKLQYLEELQSQQRNLADQNIDDVIEAQIFNVKANLKHMRDQKLPVDEQKTIEQIVRKRNEYKMFLRDYLTLYNQKQNDMKQSRGKVQQSHQKKMKKIRHEEGDLKRQYENEHLSMYYKMRDEKLNYLRKIHRIIFELEKRKIIDEKKDHLQIRRQQNIATRNALSSIENAYNDRIAMLKDKLRQERSERHVAAVAQKQILSKLERELKNEKLRQIEELKDVHRQEKGRFEFLIKDDGDLEQKILQIYKKY